MSSDTGIKVAFVIAANTTGGHEYQARALVDDFAQFSQVSVFINRDAHLPLFEDAHALIHTEPDLFLSPGWLGKQVMNGFHRMRRIRHLLHGYDHVIVCAGAVEAGVCTSLALAGKKNVSLYLPSFCDRRVVWGRIGCIYNLILGYFGVFYKNVITINRIQARLIRGFLRRPTIVIPNRIRKVPKAPLKGEGRVLCICRLDAQKRIPELLRWLDFADNPYHKILIVGDGPQREEVTKVAVALQHIEATLVGWLEPEEQDQLIHSNDVLILNSVIEGEPLVIREANSRGIRVLARDIPGVRAITLKSNRFDSQATLQRLLHATYFGEISQRRERRHDDDKSRQRNALRIFSS